MGLNSALLEWALGGYGLILPGYPRIGNQRKNRSGLPLADVSWDQHRGRHGGEFDELNWRRRSTVGMGEEWTSRLPHGLPVTSGGVASISNDTSDGISGLLPPG